MWNLLKDNQNTKTTCLPENISQPQLNNNPLKSQDRVSDVTFIITYNPALPIINKIIQNNLSILQIDEDMKNFSPSKSLITIYRREKNF